MKFVSVDFFKADLDTMNPIYKDVTEWLKHLIDVQPTIDIDIPEQFLNDWYRKYRGKEYGNKSDN